MINVRQSENGFIGVIEEKVEMQERRDSRDTKKISLLIYFHGNYNR